MFIIFRKSTTNFRTRKTVRLKNAEKPDEQLFAGVCFLLLKKLCNSKNYSYLCALAKCEVGLHKFFNKY